MAHFDYLVMSEHSVIITQEKCGLEVAQSKYLETQLIIEINKNSVINDSKVIENDNNYDYE